MLMDSASLMLAAGRYDQAIERTHKALELDPNFWWSYQVLGLAYERKKQYPEAIAALEKARFVDSNPAISGYLGYVYAAAGKKAEAQRILEELKEVSNRRYVDPYSIAIIYTGLPSPSQTKYRSFINAPNLNRNLQKPWGMTMTNMGGVCPCVELPEFSC